MSTPPSGLPAVAGRHLAGVVARLVAGDQDAAADLARFGVTMVVAPVTDAARLRRIDAVDGLSRVTSGGAVVWRAPLRTGELVIVDRLPPSRAGATPSPGRVALPATPGFARTRIARGGAGRLLVLAETGSSHWRATLDGRPLSRADDGWAQAWSLPPSGGVLSVQRTGDRRHWWLAGELALLAVLVLAAVPGRRRAAGGGSA